MSSGPGIAAAPRVAGAGLTVISSSTRDSDVRNLSGSAEVFAARVALRVVVDASLRQSRELS
jgi:hypothetical protein